MSRIVYLLLISLGIAVPIFFTEWTLALLGSVITAVLVALGYLSVKAKKARLGTETGLPMIIVYTLAGFVIIPLLITWSIVLLARGVS
jgi:hypothetical protein